MLRISARACHTFTLGEIFTMAAMNVETVRLDSAPELPERRRKYWLLRTVPDTKAGAALSS